MPSRCERRRLERAAARCQGVSGRHAGGGQESGVSFPGLALREVYDMCNALIHGYDGVDVSVVWKTIRRDIPQLREALTAEFRKQASTEGESDAIRG